MKNQIINEMLSKISVLYRDMKDRNSFLHPIASDYMRPEVIKYIFKCLDEGIDENECAKDLTKELKFKDKCEHCGFSEKEIFEAAVLFSYRTLKAYKEQLNTESK